MENQAATIYLVDDDPDVRRSLAALAVSSGFGCEAFASAEEFLDRCRECECRRRSPAGCLVIDLQLQNMGGIALHEALLARGCLMPVIFVSGYADVRTTVQVMRNGAVTLLEKPVSCEELIAAVRKAIDIDRTSLAFHARQQETCRRLDTLDPREAEVLELVVAGVANKCISSKMGISRRTVDRLRASVFQKMGVESAVELTRLLGEARATSHILRGPHRDLPATGRRLRVLNNASSAVS